jgi:hypothetical protein
LKRWKGVTLYGAIGNFLPKAIFKLGRSTNKEEFTEFLKAVVKEIPDGVTPYIVFDNHASHWSSMA